MHALPRMPVYRPGTGARVGVLLSVTSSRAHLGNIESVREAGVVAARERDDRFTGLLPPAQVRRLRGTNEDVETDVPGGKRSAHAAQERGGEPDTCRMR